MSTDQIADDSSAETHAARGRATPVEIIAAAASAAAGLVHAAAAGSHNGQSSLMWLFALTAAAQLGWAAWIALAPSRVAAAVGALLNGAAVIAWVASRSVGLVGSLRDVEPIGTQDLVAAALGAVAAGAALAAYFEIGARRRVPMTAVAIASVVIVLVAVPAMATEHTHGGSHAHDHEETTAAGSNDAPDERDHAHAGEDHAHEGDDGAAVDASGPVVSVDDPRLTQAQRDAARALLDSTRAALARFPDEAAVLAAGYQSIGDGRVVGSFEHFVNAKYLRDTRELDPAAIESIVMQRQPDGAKRVMSAMYILSPGKTMADVPEIAGELTTWHDHQNLCWDESGTRLVGILRNGVCVPGGTFRPTPPMLHVWVDDPACGPFTGIEGHGGSNCAHTHAA